MNTFDSTRMRRLVSGSLIPLLLAAIAFFGFLIGARLLAATPPPSTPPPAASASATAAASATAPLPPVAEILRKSIEARGGSAKLRAAQTRREVGRLSLGAGSEWPFSVEHKRPAKLRMEIDLQGNRLVRVFDGLRGWQKAPQALNAEQLTPDDLHNIKNEADFDFAGPLVDTGGKGKAELVGRQAVDGHDAYRVKITLVTGDVFLYDLDAASYLPIHGEGSRQINGKQVPFESTYGDYRDVDGVKYPFLITSRIKSSANQQKMTLSKIEVNVPIDDKRFTDASTAAVPAVPPMPAVAPAAPAPAAPAAPTPATPPTQTTPPVPPGGHA